MTCLSIIVRISNFGVKELLTCQVCSGVAPLQFIARHKFSLALFKNLHVKGYVVEGVIDGVCVILRVHDWFEPLRIEVGTALEGPILKWCKLPGRVIVDSTRACIAIVSVIRCLTMVTNNGVVSRVWLSNDYDGCGTGGGCVAQLTDWRTTTMVTTTMVMMMMTAAPQVMLTTWKVGNPRHQTPNSMRLLVNSSSVRSWKPTELSSWQLWCYVNQASASKSSARNKTKQKLGCSLFPFTVSECVIIAVRAAQYGLHDEL